MGVAFTHGLFQRRDEIIRVTWIIRKAHQIFVIVPFTQEGHFGGRFGKIAMKARKEIYRKQIIGLIIAFAFSLALIFKQLIINLMSVLRDFSSIAANRLSTVSLNA